jgi:hypothetical protein
MNFEKLAPLADDVFTLAMKLRNPVKKTPETKEKKASSLDLALGQLLMKFGPSMQKHAALDFFTYRLDKELLDQQALGAPFCKLASRSGLDPWQMARRIVESYVNIEKVASGPYSKAKELAQFYVQWADQIVKQAGFISNMKGVASAMAAKPAAPMAAVQKTKSFVGNMKNVSAATNRAGQMSAYGKPAAVASQPAAAVQKTQKLMTPYGKPAAAGAGAGATPGKPSQLGNVLAGTAVLGGVGLGANAMLGSDSNAQPQY